MFPFWCNEQPMAAKGSPRNGCHNSASIMTASRLAVSMAIIVTLFSFATVDGRGPPRIVTDNYQRQHVANVGETLRLACPVDASGGGSSASGPAVAAAAAAAGGPLAPRPLVSWSKDGDVIHEVVYERYKIKQHDTLFIRDVEMDDTGIFVCRATNGFGSVDVKHVVFVVAPGNNSVTPPSNFDEDYILKIRGEPPTFDNPVDNLYTAVPLGGNTRLSCHASGRPKPDIRWFKNDNPVEPDAGGGWPILSLYEVTTQHAGRYMCQVSNRFGSITRTFVVHISGNNSPDGAPVFQPAEAENVTVESGETASLQCRIYSDSPISVQWVRQSDEAGELALPRRSVPVVTSPTDGSDRYYVARLTVHMTSPSDSGEYQCIAVNDRGVTQRSIYLHVRLAASDFSAMTKTTVVVGLFGDTPSGQLSVVTPISVVCIGIVLVIVVSAIAFVVCRRRGRCRSRSEKSSPTLALSTHPHLSSHHYQQPASATTYLPSTTIGRSQVPPVDEQYNRLQWQPMVQQQQQPLQPQNRGPPPPASATTAAWCRQQQQCQQWQQPMFAMPPTSLQSSPLPHQPLLQQQQPIMPGPSLPQEPVVEYRYYEEC